MQDFKDVIDQLSDLTTPVPLVFQLQRGFIDFIKIENNMLHNNVMMVDSKLPEILGYVAFYRKTFEERKLAMIIQRLNQLNPLKYARINEYQFYSYKIKSLLTALALGLNSEEVWPNHQSGQTSKGIYYEFYEKEGQDYLLQHACVEIEAIEGFKENPTLLTKVILQIRFEYPCPTSNSTTSTAMPLITKITAP